MKIGIIKVFSNSSATEYPKTTYHFFKSDDFEYSIEKTIAYSIVLFLALFGNMFIILTIFTDVRLKLSCNLFVANMAISDLISSLVFVPLQIGTTHNYNIWPIEGTFGEIICKTGNFIPKTSTAVSFYSCLFIAVDRYLAVAYPLKGGFRRSRLKYIIPAIWIFSALIVSPYFYSFQLVNVMGSNFCVTKNKTIFQTHFYVLLVSNLGIPLPIITTLYILIVYKLYRHKTPGHQTDAVRIRRVQQNRKVFKMSITIVSLLYLSWGFFSIVFILGFEQIINFERIKFYALFFAHLSYAYNFFIYLIFNDIYRKNFKSMISKLICKFWFTRVASANISGEGNAANRGFDNDTQTQVVEIRKIELEN